jgi:pyruvate/2-oxoglutarate dehydrogenase complex dihydrolipoamide acyltransferase (E2) component
MTTSSSSAAPKPKRAKVFTRRPKPHSLERTVAVLGMEKMEIAELAKAIPLASETIPDVTVEASVGPVEGTETKSSKAKERPKLLSPPTMTGLLKLTTTTPMTPRKRRMASVLDAVLKSTKMPTLVSTEALKDKIEDLREVAAASTSPVHVEAGPSGTKPVEMAKESLPKKPTLPILEASSQGDLEYIVQHASGKQLSEE